MRKKIIRPAGDQAVAGGSSWLDLDRTAEVEVTSEDPDHPIEAALLDDDSASWRAAEPGQQMIRLNFQPPQQLRRILLRFDESRQERTQQFVLRYRQQGDDTLREIVRQQWNFSPNGSTSEVEDYQVDLADVATLELDLVPDLADRSAVASLRQWRVG